MAELILIVDDHLDCAMPLKVLLRQYGHRVECVQSAAEAMDFMRQERPSLLLLDNMMPAVSGLELLRELRADPELASMPVAMYSASDLPEEMEECRRLGADFICKGRIDYTDLILRIHQLVTGAVPADLAVAGINGHTGAAMGPAARH